jgi:FixJ family two-component response regulator
LFDHLPKPGCILLDAHLLNLNGLNLQTRLTELGSTLPVVLLASCPDIEGTVLAIKTGAKGAMAQHFNEHASKNAINGHHVHFASLTPREQQVFHLVVRGNVNKQIAHYLGTTVRTVKAHRKGVMEKMRARSLVELVSIAARLGELDE